MLVFIYSNDANKAFKSANKLAKSKAQATSAQYFFVNKEDFLLSDLQEFLSSFALFKKESIYNINLEDDKEAFDKFMFYIAEFSKSHNLFVCNYSGVLKDDDLEKIKQKSVLFKDLSLDKTFDSRQKNIFVLLDELFIKKDKKAYFKIREEMQKDDINKIYGAIWWYIKTKREKININEKELFEFVSLQNKAINKNINLAYLVESWLLKIVLKKR